MHTKGYQSFVKLPVVARTQFLSSGRGMKFLYSDSLDYVDPEYDFLNDRTGAKRRAHEDDDFPHEHLDCAPYDGLLISRAIVGDARRPGKYNEAQCMRFRREGARAFLRFPIKSYPDSMIMGDCGAFSYRAAKTPPYKTDDTLEFYEDGAFTHGCSVDHLIFDFLDDAASGPAEARRRFDITLDNAENFLKGSKALGRSFTPVGVIQGWSAKSMAQAGALLCKQGYKYLAVGGMVPLKIEQIEAALTAIRGAIPRSTRLHLLGFGKTEQLDRLRKYRISSFDTTSPLLRAFKDGRRNYYANATVAIFPRAISQGFRVLLVEQFETCLIFLWGFFVIPQRIAPVSDHRVHRYR